MPLQESFEQEPGWQKGGMGWRDHAPTRRLSSSEKTTIQRHGKAPTRNQSSS
jgi:hypothetical protein